MQNIKLTIAYDGTAYKGWQKTSMGPSIEETLQKALEHLLQQPIMLQAASRTDAGVHALGQVVNFCALKPQNNLIRLQIGLNALLPKDISVLNAKLMPSDFHPTLQAQNKEYHYYICNDTAQLPQYRLYSWHYPYPLDKDAMNQTIPLLKGCHDFSAFCNIKKHSNYQHFVRNIHNMEIIELEGNRLCIRIIGNKFLYKMVRNMVGTIIYVGRGKILKEEIFSILKSGDRRKAGVTAPAHGLFLHHVYYNNQPPS